MNEAIAYMLRILIFGQPFICWWILETDIKLSEKQEEIGDYIIYVGFSILIATIFLSGFEFDFYTVQLLLQYAFFIPFTFLYMRDKYSFKDSLALSLLLVFLNSFYWESVLHFAELTMLQFDITRLREFWHLVPLPIILRNFRVNRKSAIKNLRIGLIYSFIISVISIEMIGYARLIPFPFLVKFMHRNYTLRKFLNFTNRLVCLFLLIQTMRWNAGKKTVLKAQEEIRMKREEKRRSFFDYGI